MNIAATPYRIFPLGDAAITIEFGNIISETINQQVLALFSRLQQSPFPGMIEAVPAYHSLTVYYDVFDIRKKTDSGSTAFDYVSAKLQELLQESLDLEEKPGNLVNIPVCYDREFAPDIESLAATKNITVDDLVTVHTSKDYRVYMLGFTPGFCYLGEVDDTIALARKPLPVPVAAGSVGIAGRQTGIYPMMSPGGWHIIGRTPLQLFDPNREEPTLLKAGDTVRFISISKNEFESY